MLKGYMLVIRRRLRHGVRRQPSPSTNTGPSRSTAAVLQYLASPKEALASITAGQLLLQLLVAAAVFGGMRGATCAY